jgi:glycosyltransferase involved in cell wall biosynthesis
LKFGMLDGIVCVSQDQMPVLAHLVPHGRCVFIPHGVDTEFFQSSSNVPFESAVNGPLLLAVGAHRRDFTTLVSAARIIRRARPDTRVKLIGPRDRICYAAESGVIETESDLKDSELRDAYRACTMLLLPLEAATANNALLESMSVGRPAVISDFPGVRDYTGTDAALLCSPGSAEAHAQAALTLLGDAERCAAMGRAARQRVQQFSWPRIYTQLLEFFREVGGG